MARVQEKASSKNTAGLSWSVTLDNPVGSGNVVCGVVGFGGGISIDSILDDKGNSYDTRRTITDTSNDEQCVLFYRLNITNAPTIITVTLGANSGNNIGIGVVEFGGRLTSLAENGDIGQWETNPGTGTDGANSTAIVTTVDGDDIFAGAIDSGAFRASNFSLGTGFTNLAQAGTSTTLCVAVASRTQASQGSIEATFTSANDEDTITMIMAFKPAAPSTTPITVNNLTVDNLAGGEIV